MSVSKEELDRAAQLPKSDARFVYGARCCWSGSIGDVSTTARGLPCCPHCGGVLFELDTEEEWWTQVREHAAKVRDETYEPMFRWARGKCFPNMEAMQAAYREFIHSRPDGGGSRGRRYA